MRLSELNPRWVGTGLMIFGVTFDCPHCRTQRVGVLFQKEIDPEHLIEHGTTRFHQSVEWVREGDTFETLTLSPSLDFSDHGHWHGFVQNGEAK